MGAALNASPVPVRRPQSSMCDEPMSKDFYKAMLFLAIAAGLFFALSQNDTVIEISRAIIGKEPRPIHTCFTSIYVECAL